MSHNDQRAGTGSAPPEAPDGNALSGTVSQPPRRAPCRSSASTAYAEQVGSNWQQGGRFGLISRWYTPTAAIIRSARRAPRSPRPLPAHLAEGRRGEQERVGAAADRAPDSTRC